MNSGLLLVTGPYSVNGVPLRRAHQKSVISTTTQIEVTIEIPDFITDAYFSEPKKSKQKNSDFFENAPPSGGVSRVTDERKATQKLVDEQFLNYLKTVPYLKDYLAQKFSLSKGQLPHKMVF